MVRRLKLAIIGWGAIARGMASVLAQAAAPVDVVAVAVRDAGRARDDLPAGAALIDDPAALAALRPDLVVEAAGRASVVLWGEAALASAREFAVASVSAFTDEALFDRLQGLAEAHGSRLVIPSGAVGALDALSAASLGALAEVSHRIVKPPAGWRGTAAEALVDLDGLTGPVPIFEGSAREAAARFPQNANAALATALAGLGLDRTRVALVADPGATLNRHEIAAAGAFGRFAITLENAPLLDNPRSSALTGLSLARLVLNRVGSPRFG